MKTILLAFLMSVGFGNGVYAADQTDLNTTAENKAVAQPAKNVTPQSDDVRGGPGGGGGGMPHGGGGGGGMPRGNPGGGMPHGNPGGGMPHGGGQVGHPGGHPGGQVGHPGGERNFPRGPYHGEYSGGRWHYPDGRYYPVYPRDWRWDYSWHPFWYSAGIVFPAWAWIDTIPAGYWQCTAFDQRLEPFAAVGPDQLQASYNAIYECGGQEAGCYIPPGYCQFR